jgi:hypothetical protein
MTSEVLKGYVNHICFVYLDDIIVFGDTREEFLNNLQQEGEIRLYCDASEEALGGHLVQLQNGEEQSIMFVNKTFTEAQKKWATGEKEMYAIVYCVDKLRYLIGGRPFVICTDHRNLKFISSDSASPKIMRWRHTLSEFEYIIRYIKGEMNSVADAFSRLTFKHDIDISGSALNVLTLRPMSRHNKAWSDQPASVLIGHSNTNLDDLQQSGRALDVSAATASLDRDAANRRVCAADGPRGTAIMTGQVSWGNSGALWDRSSWEEDARGWYYLARYVQ